jgi:hypothetical protein
VPPSCARSTQTRSRGCTLRARPSATRARRTCVSTTLTSVGCHATTRRANCSRRPSMHLYLGLRNRRGTDPPHAKAHEDHRRSHTIELLGSQRLNKNKCVYPTPDVACRVGSVDSATCQLGHDIFLLRALVEPSPRVASKNTQHGAGLPPEPRSGRVGASARPRRVLVQC